MAHSPLFQQLLRTLQQARRANLAEAGEPAPVAREGFRLTRRGFLKLAGAGAAGLALHAGANPLVRAQTDDPAPRIAIVGGGMAGLNAAHQLQKLGYAATVYEASSRLGGRIWSLTGLVGDGLVNEMGGALINSDHEDMLALVEEFNLSLFNRREDAERLGLPAGGYLFDGQAHSEADIAEKLRPFAEQVAADSALLDEDFETHAPTFDAISVQAYLDQHSDKISDPLIRRLVEHAIRSEYGVEPEESSAIQLIWMLPTVDGESVEMLGASDEIFMVEGGNDQIIDGLAGALEGQIRRRMRLTRLEAQGDGYRLAFNGNGSGGEQVEADYVILAIPFTVLRTIDLAVELPETLRRFIDEVDLGRNGKLFAGMTQKAWRQPGGFAMEAWCDMGFSVCWDATQRQTDREDGALTIFLGGADLDAATQRGAREQGRAFLERLDAILPGMQQASNDRFLYTRWHWSQLTRGAYTSFKPGQYLTFADFLYIEAEDPEERQDVHVGNLVFAGEHLSDAYYGFMNGAAETGRLAAQVVARLATAEG